MSTPSRRSPQIKKLARPLIATGLIAGGLFQLVPPVLSLGTAANTSITNKATATYTDPANPNTPLNAESNTVTVTVAEVAGLTNVSAGIVDENGGSINSNDVVNYDFLITNTGNSSNSINIPYAAIKNPDNNLTVAGFFIDLNNDGDFDDAGESNNGNPWQLADLVTTGTFPTGVSVTTTGILTALNIAADASIKIRVVTTVNAGLGASQPVAIQLGNTPPNDNSASTQNQLYDGDATVDDIFTSATTAVNSQREAAANQGSLTSLSVRPLALATVLKTRAAYAPNTTATTDDDITYRLDLRVASTSPNPAFTPANLEGTAIRLSTDINGTNPADVQRILVSDAIPVGTVLTSTAIPTIANWKVVYSTTATTTSTVGNNLSGAAVWQTVAPGDLTTVKRIGWIYVGPNNVSDVTPIGPSLAAGSTTTGDANGFRFQVRTTGLATGGTVANIAQSFGETVGDPNNEVVYDESGDQNPNNFNDDNTPPDPTGTNYVPVTDTGVANPATQGTDNNNNNTGTGEKGEANILAITQAGAILNGPLNQPGAVGPTDNNDDFVNKSSLLVDDGNAAATSTTVFTATPGTIFNPEPVVFDNTFQNPPSNTGNLDTVRLLPLAPNAAAVPVNSRQEAVDIPTGTLVTITAGTSRATYRYDGAAYVYDATIPGSGPNFDSTANTLKFDGVSPGVAINYTVTIDLPADSALSADRFIANGASRAGYSVPVVAFVDNNNSGAFEVANDNVYNIKIDRLYLGHLALRKEQRVLDTNGTTVVRDWTTADIAQDTLSNSLIPGRFIEYRISYVNFSTPSAGAGNVTLGISNLVITEDGSATPNNWALFTTHQQNTSASLGTVRYFNGATDLGTLDPSSGAAVTRYINNVGTLSPDVAVTPIDTSTYQGNFTFRRLLN